MAPTKDLYKYVIKLMHLTAVYFPQTDKKITIVFYWIYCILCNCLIWLWALRFVILLLINSEDQGVSIVAMAFLLCYVGNAYQVAGFCFGASKYFPKFLKKLDEYRLLFGELEKMTQIRRLHKFLGFSCIAFASSIVANFMQLREYMFTAAKNTPAFFYPLDINNPITMISFQCYLIVVLCLISVVSILAFILFLSTSYIFVSEIGNIETRIKELVYYKIASSSNCKTKTRIEINRTREITPLCRTSMGLKLKGNRIDTDLKLADVLQPFEQREGQTLKDNSDLKQNNTGNNSTNIDHEDALEALRQKYEMLLDILSTVNDCLTHFCFSSFVTTIPLTCLVLYGQIRSTLTNEFLNVLVAITFTSISQMCMVLFVGAYVSVKIKKPLEHVMKIDTRNCSHALMSTVSLFAVRLMSPPTGFTIYELFAIDTTTILTIAGTFLTYIVVMVQFAQTPDGGSVSCSNGTGTL